MLVYWYGFVNVWLWRLGFFWFVCLGCWSFCLLVFCVCNWCCVCLVCLFCVVLLVGVCFWLCLGFWRSCVWVCGCLVGCWSCWCVVLRIWCGWLLVFWYYSECLGCFCWLCWCCIGRIYGNGCVGYVCRGICVVFGSDGMGRWVCVCVWLCSVLVVWLGWSVVLFLVVSGCLIWLCWLVYWWIVWSIFGVWFCCWIWLVVCWIVWILVFLLVGIWSVCSCGGWCLVCVGM